MSLDTLLLIGYLVVGFVFACITTKLMIDDGAKATRDPADTGIMFIFLWLAWLVALAGILLWVISVGVGLGVQKVFGRE